MKPTTRQPQGSPRRQTTTSRGYRQRSGTRTGTRTPGNRTQTGTPKQRLAPPLASRPRVKAPLIAQQSLSHTPTVKVQTPTTPATVAPSLSTQVFTAARSALTTAKQTAARAAALTTAAMMTGGAALAAPQTEEQAAEAFRQAVHNSSHIAETAQTLQTVTTVGVAGISAIGLFFIVRAAFRRATAPAQTHTPRTEPRIEPAVAPSLTIEGDVDVDRPNDPGTQIDESAPSAAAITQHSVPADPARPTVADPKTAAPDMVVQDGQGIALGDAKTKIRPRKEHLERLQTAQTTTGIQVTTTVPKEPETAKTLKLPTKPTELEEFKAGHILLDSIERIFNKRGQKADSLLKLDINILRGLKLTKAIRLQLDRLHALLIAPIAPAQTRIDEMLQNLNNSLNQLETITTNLSQDGEGESDNPDQNDDDQDDILALAERLKTNVNNMPSSKSLVEFNVHQMAIKTISDKFDRHLQSIDKLGQSDNIDKAFDKLSHAQTQFNELSTQTEFTTTDIETLYQSLHQAAAHLATVYDTRTLQRKIQNLKKDIEKWSRHADPVGQITVQLTLDPYSQTFVKAEGLIEDVQSSITSALEGLSTREFTGINVLLARLRNLDGQVQKLLNDATSQTDETDNKQNAVQEALTLETIQQTKLALTKVIVALRKDAGNFQSAIKILLAQDAILTHIKDEIANATTQTDSGIHLRAYSDEKEPEAETTAEESDLLNHMLEGLDDLDLPGVEFNQEALQPQRAQDAVKGADLRTGEMPAEPVEIELDFSGDDGIEIDFTDPDAEPAVDVQAQPALQGDGPSTAPYAQKDAVIQNNQVLFLALGDLQNSKTHHESKLHIAQNMIAYLESGKPVTGFTRREYADKVVQALSSEEFKTAVNAEEADIKRNEFERTAESLIKRLQNRFLPQETGFILDHNHNLVPVTFIATAQLDEAIAKAGTEDEKAILEEHKSNSAGRDISTVPVSGDSQFNIFVNASSDLSIYDETGAFIGSYNGRSFRNPNPVQTALFEREYDNINNGLSVLGTMTIATRDQYEHMAARVQLLEEHPQPSQSQKYNMADLHERLASINPEPKVQGIIDEIIGLVSTPRINTKIIRSAAARITKLNGHAQTYATDRQLYFVHFVFPAIMHAQKTHQDRTLSRVRKKGRVLKILKAIRAIGQLRDQITQIGIMIARLEAHPEDISSEIANITSNIELLRAQKEIIEQASASQPESYKAILRKTIETIERLKALVKRATPNTIEQPAAPAKAGDGSETRFIPNMPQRQVPGVIPNHTGTPHGPTPARPDQPTATTGPLAMGQLGTPPAPQRIAPGTTSEPGPFESGLKAFFGLPFRALDWFLKQGQTRNNNAGTSTTPSAPTVAPRAPAPAPRPVAPTPAPAPVAPAPEPIKGAPFNIKDGLKPSDNLRVTWQRTRRATPVTSDIRFGQIQGTDRQITPNAMKQIPLPSPHISVGKVITELGLEVSTASGHTRLTKMGENSKLTNTDIKNFVKTVASALLQNANQNPSDQNRLDHFMTFVNLFSAFNSQHLTVSVIQVQTQDGNFRPVALIQSKGNEIRNVNYVVDFFDPDANHNVLVTWKGLNKVPNKDFENLPDKTIRYRIDTKADNIAYNNGVQLKYDHFDPNKFYLM